MNYPKPGNITELRSFMGMVNQLGDFTKEISSAAQPLRGLLSEKSKYQWVHYHDQAFDAVKEVIKSLPMLCHYYPIGEVILYSDASRLNGLGYILAQVVDGQFKLIKCGSRFLLPTESKYSTTEFELLGIVWGIPERTSDSDSTLKNT